MSQQRHVGVLGHEVSRGFAWVSDLEHWERRLDPHLAFLAEVVIWPDCTLVPDTDDRVGIAAITSKLGMDYLGLLGSLFLEMLGKKFLILRGAALGDFVAQDLLEVFEESVVESPCAIALLAWQTLLVDLLSVALEALWKIFHIFDRLFCGIQIVVLWLDDEALDVLLLSDVVLLLASGLDHNLGAALGVSGDSLRLGGALLGVDHGSDLFVLSIGCVGVEALAIGDGLLLTKILDHVTGIG